MVPIVTGVSSIYGVTPLFLQSRTGGGGSSGPAHDSTGGCDDVHVYGQSSCQANRSGGGRADKGPRIVETVTYPNGTVLAEYSNGAYAVNGYVLPFYIEDPYQLARVADAELSKLGAIDDELLRTLLALSGACNTGEAGCQGFHLAAINDDLRAYSSMLRGAKSETTRLGVRDC